MGIFQVRMKHLLLSLFLMVPCCSIYNSPGAKVSTSIPINVSIMPPASTVLPL